MHSWNRRPSHEHASFACACVKRFYAFLKDFPMFNTLNVFLFFFFLLIRYSFIVVTLLCLVTSRLWRKSRKQKAGKQSVLFTVRTSRKMKKGVCRYGVRDRERVFTPESEHLPDIKPVVCHQVKKASNYSFHESRPFDFPHLRVWIPDL